MFEKFRQDEKVAVVWLDVLNAREMHLHRGPSCSTLALRCGCDVIAGDGDGVGRIWPAHITRPTAEFDDPERPSLIDPEHLIDEKMSEFDPIRLRLGEVRRPS